MNYFVELSICKILNLPLNPKIIEYCIKKKNLKYFGVFVSILRFSKNNKNIVHKNKNIHGCIGYYVKSFNVKHLSTENLLQKTLDVSLSATNKDNRRYNFKNLFFEDATTTCRIYFMKSPVLEINKYTGIINKTQQYFTNELYGVIILNTKTQNTATFLPNIFKNISWHKLKKYLFEKLAPNTNNVNIENYIFFAYQCDIVESKFIDIFLKNANYIKFIFEIFLEKFININYVHPSNAPPYLITADQQIIFKKKSYIRNLGVINNILKLHTITNKLKPQIITKIKKYIDECFKKKIYHENFEAAKIIQVFKQLNVKKKQAKIICKELQKNIQIDSKKIDEIFILSQILISIIQICPPQFSLILQKQKQMYLDELNSANTNIFKINWNIQFIFELIRLLTVKKKIIPKIIYLHINLLFQKLQNYLYTNKLTNKTETNYLVVIFESLCFFKIIFRIFFENDEKTNIILDKYLLEIIFRLHCRIMSQNYLFTFTNNTARIDITCHYLNGLYNLFRFF